MALKLMILYLKILNKFHKMNFNNLNKFILINNNEKNLTNINLKYFRIRISKIKIRFLLRNFLVYRK